MRAIDENGLDEEIRCEMCKNPMHTDRGCDGNCKYDEKLYEKIIQILNKRITPLPSAQPDLSSYSDKLWHNAYERGRAEAQAEIIHCRECKYWRQQTNYQGALLSFGFCESDNMWRSLYGETYEVSHIDTDDDFYCGYAERREE